MVVGTIRFYLDENVEVAVAEQLRRRGIEVVTVSELGVAANVMKSTLRVQPR